MQLNRVHAMPARRTKSQRDATVQHLRSVTFDQEIVERGAQALFEFVFAGTERLDGKHSWSNAHEETKAGFRAEATAVLEAVRLCFTGTSSGRASYRSDKAESFFTPKRLQSNCC